jgi:hypothetical protein
VPLPTEEEFAHQRAVIRETYFRLFEAVEEQLAYVDEHLRGIVPAPPSKFDLALVAHLARASKTALGICRTCEHGFGEIAMSAIRTLGETMVSAYWMSLDKEARADQFEDYARLEALDTLEFVEAMGWADVEVPAELRDQTWVDAVNARFPNPAQGWTQQPMNRLMAGVRPCWPTEAARGDFDRIGRLLHLYGDRHSHVGTFDTLM